MASNPSPGCNLKAFCKRPGVCIATVPTASLGHASRCAFVPLQTATRQKAGDGETDCNDGCMLRQLGGWRLGALAP